MSMAKRRIKVFQQNYPPVPVTAKEEDVVKVNYTYKDEKNYPHTVLVGRVYCPREPVVNGDTLFDPTSPTAQFYLHKYKKRFENRRRYDRELRKRRLKNEEDATGDN
jgi:hypothetical protein